MLGLVAAAFIALAFAVGAFDALVANHFTSWNRLSIEPTDGLAKAVEGLLPIARVVTMIGAAIFGYTTVRRINPENYRRAGIRLGLVAFSPIVVEVLDFGTQDGQVPDLDKLPPHSMVLLALITVVPVGVAVWDATVLRREARAFTATNPS